MSVMCPVPPARRYGWTRVLAGTTVMLGAVALASWISRGDAPAPATIQAAAVIAAVGTIAVGLMFASVTPYPRLSYLASIGLLAGSILLTSLYAGTPAAWKTHARPELWMAPWYLLIINTITPARAECTTGRWAAWGLPGAAALLGAFLHVPILFGWL